MKEAFAHPEHHFSVAKMFTISKQATDQWIAKFVLVESFHVLGAHFVYLLDITQYIHPRDVGSALL